MSKDFHIFRLLVRLLIIPCQLQIEALCHYCSFSQPIIVGHKVISHPIRLQCQSISVDAHLARVSLLSVQNGISNFSAEVASNPSLMLQSPDVAAASQLGLLAP